MNRHEVLKSSQFFSHKSEVSKENITSKSKKPYPYWEIQFESNGDSRWSIIVLYDLKFSYVFDSPIYWGSKV